MLVLSALTIWALISRSTAIEQGSIAQSRFLATQSNAIGRDYSLSMLLAVAATESYATQEAHAALLSSMLRFSSVERYLFPHSGSVLDMAFSEDGKTVASVSDDHTLAVTAVESHSQPMTVALPALATHVAINHNGSLVAAGLADGTLIIWQSGIELTELWRADHENFTTTDLSLSTDGTRLAISTYSRDKGGLSVYEFATGDALVSVSLEDLEIQQIAFDPTDTEIVVLDGRRQVRYFSAANLNQVRPLKQCESQYGNVARYNNQMLIDAVTLVCYASELQPEQDLSIDVQKHVVSKLNQLGRTITSAAFSPDFRRLTLGFAGGKIEYLDLSTVDGNWSLSIDQTGEHLVVIDGVNKVRVFTNANSAGKSYYQSVDRMAPTLSYASTVAIDHEGERFAVGAGIYDSGVYLWRSNEDRPYKVLRSYREELSVSALAFHPLRPTLVASYGDGSLVFWDLLGNREIGTIRQQGRLVKRLSFKANGDTLTIEFNNHEVMLIDMNTINWRQTACEIVSRGLTQSELTQYGINTRQQGCQSADTTP